MFVNILRQQPDKYLSFDDNTHKNLFTIFATTEDKN